MTARTTSRFACDIVRPVSRRVPTAATGGLVAAERRGWPEPATVTLHVWRSCFRPRPALPLFVRTRSVTEGIAALGASLTAYVGGAARAARCLVAAAVAAELLGGETVGAVLIAEQDVGRRPAAVSRPEQECGWMARNRRSAGGRQPKRMVRTPSSQRPRTFRRA